MRTLFLILSALSMMCNVYCMENGESVNKSSYSSGYRRYGKESLDSIEANGPVTLEGTKVLGLVLVNGSLNAQGSTIGSLYPNNFKIWFLAKRKRPRFNDRKRPNINNMGSFAIVKSRVFLKAKIPNLEVVWV